MKMKWRRKESASDRKAQGKKGQKERKMNEKWKESKVIGRQKDGLRDKVNKSSI